MEKASKPTESVGLIGRVIGYDSNPATPETRYKPYELKLVWQEEHEDEAGKKQKKNEEWDLKQMKKITAKQGCTSFPKTQEPPENYRLQKGDVQQVA